MSMTLDTLRVAGLWADQAERWVPAVNKFTGEHGIRMDLFGFIDIVAIDVIKKQTIGVQAAGEGERRSHLKKITEYRKKYAEAWLMAGNRILLFTWSKRKVNGRPKWGCIVDEVWKDIGLGLMVNENVVFGAKGRPSLYESWLEV
jgi:hypothetical protein